jgi:hypothetical protein
MNTTGLAGPKKSDTSLGSVLTPQVSGKSELGETSAGRSAAGDTKQSLVVPSVGLKYFTGPANLVPPVTIDSMATQELTSRK